MKNSSNASLRVSILHYDAGKHQFAPALCFFKERHNDGRDHASITPRASPQREMISLNEFQQALGTKSVPSAAWTNNYTEWRDWDCSGHSDGNNDLASRCPHHQAVPIFSSVEQLQAFNYKGQELVELLRQELQALQQTTSKFAVEAEDFVPILSSIQVGENWWHVRDFHYGFVVPIQRLPVSTNLKSRLQAWRFHKGTCLLQTCQQAGELRQECRELEESIVLELNAKSDYDPLGFTRGNSQWDGDEFPPICSNHCDSAAADAHTDKRFDWCAWLNNTAVSSYAK